MRTLRFRLSLCITREIRSTDGGAYPCTRFLRGAVHGVAYFYIVPTEVIPTACMSSKAISREVFWCAGRTKNVEVKRHLLCSDLVAGGCLQIKNELSQSSILIFGPPPEVFSTHELIRLTSQHKLCSFKGRAEGKRRETQKKIKTKTGMDGWNSERRCGTKIAAEEEGSNNLGHNRRKPLLECR